MSLVVSQCFNFKAFNYQGVREVMQEKLEEAVGLWSTPANHDVEGRIIFIEHCDGVGYN